MKSLKQSLCESFEIISEAKFPKEINIKMGEHGRELKAKVWGKPVDIFGREFVIAKYFGDEDMPNFERSGVFDLITGQSIQYLQSGAGKQKDVEKTINDAIGWLIKSVGEKDFISKIEKQKVLNKF